MNRDEAIALVKGPFGSAVREVIVSYAAPFFWATQITSNQWKFGNGTCFFLDCGKGPFLVTADHVYSGYLARKAEFPGTDCQILNLAFRPEERLIDRNEKIDIATFRITSREIEQVGKVNGRDVAPKIVLKGDQSAWPPTPPEKEKGVWFAGCPGGERLVTGKFEINFGIFTALASANNINERQISCHFEREYEVVTPEDPPLPQGYDLGGVSGAPLLTVGDREGLITWRLGGVVTEANSSLEVVFASRADFIRQDGSVREPGML